MSTCQRIVANEIRSRKAHATSFARLFAESQVYWCTNGLMQTIH